MTRSLLALITLLAPGLALAAPTPVSRPAAGPTITEAGLPLASPPSVERGLYHGDVFTVGNDDVIVVITESGDAARPAHWTAVDRAGRVAWEANHACPDFSGYTILDGDGDRLLCKLPHSILGVGAVDGAEVWRFHSDRTLYITGVAGGRVATSVENEEVLVLDASDGREVGRWDVDGSVLEAVTAGPDGPVGLMIVKAAGEKTRRTTLEIGGEKLEVSVSEDSPDRRMGVLPIGGAPWAGSRPMKLRWSVPFEGYSFELVNAGGVVVGLPHDGVWEGYDLATGKRLWERKLLSDEDLVFGDQGGAFSRPDGAGHLTGAIDPRTGRDLWSHRWPGASAPGGVTQGSGQVAAWDAGRLVVDAFADGTPLTEVRGDGGAALLAASTSPFAVVWAVENRGARRLHFRALPRAGR